MAYVVDALVLAGVLLFTLGVYGVSRMRDVYLKLHATSATFVLAFLLVLVGAAIRGGPPIALRAVLIAALLLLTTPISSHAISKAAHQRRDSD